MNSNLSTKLSLGATACFLATLAPTAFAGPSSQFFNRPIPAAAKADQPAASALCPGCRTTPIVVSKSTGIPNKNQMVWIKTGTKHECTLCAGQIVTRDGSTSNQMVHDATKCGPKLCCATPTR